MRVGRQDLCKQIGNVVSGGNKDEAHNFVCNLLSQSHHLDTEVSVAACDNMIVHHCHTGLVIFEEL